MKASELVERYQQGERDFRSMNLRGLSFKGQDLLGADFSEADIRGANFSKAILTGAKFHHAKAGLQKRWVVILLLVAFLLIILFSLMSTFVIYIVSLIFNSELESQIGGLVGLITLIIFCFIAYRQSLVAALGAIAVAVAIAVAAAIVVLVAGTGSGTGTLIGAIALGVAIAIAGAIPGAIASGVVFSIAIALGVAIAIAAAIALGVVFSMAKVAMAKVAIAGAIALAFILFAYYLGYRTLKDETRDSWLRIIVVAFASIGGTSFYNADLTDVDFTGATLKSTDLRVKSLTRACWKDTVKLDLARVGQTLLSQPEVRELLVTSYGYKKSYIKANLRGANLTGANLNEANLKLADLSEATLAMANLDGANLTEVDAVGTNFTRASMTGACIEVWNIDNSTKLDQVDCQYIYLLENPKPGNDYRERRPSSGVFQPGEFTKLFEEVLDTVDLIFRNGVDWKAFVTAFKKVQVENEDTPLEIQGIENKGDGVVVVKVKVSPNTDKEKIHHEFSQNYELALQAAEEKYKAVLAAKEEQIQDYRRQSADMMEIVKLQASRPIDVKAIAMADKLEKNVEVEMNISGGQQGSVAGKVIGDFNVYASPEQKQNLAEAATEIQQLLEQLDKTYATETVVGQIDAAKDAFKLIQSNTPLADRILSALRAGGTEALKQALNHPAATFVLALLDDWQKT